MSVDFVSWLEGGEAIDVEVRAARAMRRIRRDPSSVIFRTPKGVTLPAQTVRVAPDSRASEVTGSSGAAPLMGIVVFGIRDHKTLPDTDLQEDYRFVFDKDEYQCVDVLHRPGEVQGIFVKVG